MALPDVAQAKLLADIFERMLRERAPASVAILGCAGGNGFDRIDPRVTTQVVGLDINPAYVAAARERFQQRLPGLELIVADFHQDEVRIAPVDLVFVALLFGGAVDGILAEFVCVPEHAAVRSPAHLTPTEAATLPIAGVTAWHALFALGQLQAGQTVVT